MTLSRFIQRLQWIAPNSPKVKSLVLELNAILKTKGNIEIDLDDIYKISKSI